MLGGDGRVGGEGGGGDGGGDGGDGYGGGEGGKEGGDGGGEGGGGKGSGEDGKEGGGEGAQASSALGTLPARSGACCVQVPADLGMRRTECCHVEQIGAIARDQLLARPKFVQLRQKPLPITSHAPTPR
jgi:hypothetical protein